MKNETTKKILKTSKADKTVKAIKTGEAKTKVRKEKKDARDTEIKSLGAIEAPIYNQECKSVEKIKLP